jgi:uncharacterized protein YbjT (DUF2867 family)
MNVSKLVFVTGATGYIGGRLVPRLLEAGHRVRCLVRDARRIQGHPWSDQVQVFEGDALSPETLSAAMADVWAAYYLVGSLSDTEANCERDARVAHHFGQAAKAAGVQRIIYLSRLGSPDGKLSPALQSRRKTGAALAQAGVPVTEFRVAVVVGSGSLSFEMLRYLTEPLPIAPCPRWISTRIQPIAIDDLLRYLVAALQVAESAGQTIEIGGSEVLTYGDMMQHYARLRGLRRVFVPVPVMAAHVSAYWVHWMTPVRGSIAYPVIEGLRYEAVVRDGTAEMLFPDITPVDCEMALRRALANLEEGPMETHWSGSLASTVGDVRPVELTTDQGMLIERRQKVVDAPPEQVFAVFSRLGGDQGWFYANWLWWLRGVVDRLVGGPGFRRRRRDPDEVRVGDALAFWRVEAIEPDRLMRLRAEMKVPGRAWLQLEARALEDNRTLLVQTGYMAPKGLPGLLYWYGLYPIHSVIFGGMITNMARSAEVSAVT